MASFLTSLLEGQNLSEFEKFSSDGDIRRLGTIGMNMTLIGRIERSRAESEALALRQKQEREAEMAEEDERSRIRNAYEEAHNREVAMEATARRMDGHKSPLSDDGVDDFLKF